MGVFISYARNDKQAVEQLRADIQRCRREVWLDRELTGGHSWWSTILGRIRECDAFVVAVSPDSLKSSACRSELEYAERLGKPVLPVMIEHVSPRLAPPVIANTQLVDYRQRTPDTVFELRDALDALPAAPAPPDPLPPEPPVPGSYLGPLVAGVSAPQLTYTQQSQIFVELKILLGQEEAREDVRALLAQLRERPDLAQGLAREIDATLGSEPVRPDAAPTEAVRQASKPSRPAMPPPGWYPDPAGNGTRYWDGSAWAQPWKPQPQPQVNRDFPLRPSGAQPAAGQAAAAVQEPFSAGVLTALVVGTLLSLGLVGIIAGAVSLKSPARRGQATMLLWVGVAVFVLVLLTPAY